MKRKHIFLSATLALVFFVAACSGQAVVTNCLPGHTCSSTSTFFSTPDSSLVFLSDTGDAQVTPSNASSWEDPLDITGMPPKFNSDDEALERALSTTVLIGPPEKTSEGDEGINTSTTVLIEPDVKKAVPPDKTAVKNEEVSVKSPKKLPPPKRLDPKKRTDCDKFPEGIIVKGC